MSSWCLRCARLFFSTPTPPWWRNTQPWSMWGEKTTSSSTALTTCTVRVSVIHAVNYKWDCPLFICNFWSSFAKIQISLMHHWAEKYKNTKLNGCGLSAVRSRSTTAYPHRFPSSSCFSNSVQLLSGAFRLQPLSHRWPQVRLRVVWWCWQFSLCVPGLLHRWDQTHLPCTCYSLCEILLFFFTSHSRFTLLFLSERRGNIGIIQHIMILPIILYYIIFFM